MAQSRPEQRYLDAKALSELKNMELRARLIVEGFITMDKKNMNFLARLAKLIDPEGNTVVQADEIVVPITKPEDYKVSKTKK